jgi:hypothetical protein
MNSKLRGKGFVAETGESKMMIEKVGSASARLRGCDSISLAILRDSRVNLMPIHVELVF